jgi:hypothetical protein
LRHCRRLVVVIVVNPGWDDCRGGTGGQQGGGSLRPMRPARSQTPFMLSIFGQIINPPSCLVGQGSLPSLVVLDNDLDDASPLSLQSSSSGPPPLSPSLTVPSSGTVPRTTKTTKIMTTVRRRCHGVWAPRYPVSSHASSRHPVCPPPRRRNRCRHLHHTHMLPITTTTLRATDVPRCMGWQAFYGWMEALALLLDLTTGTDGIVNRKRLV